MARFEIKNGVAIIPDSTTEIPLTAFRECPSLKTINVPSDYEITTRRCSPKSSSRWLWDLSMMRIVSKCDYWIVDLAATCAFGWVIHPVA